MPIQTTQLNNEPIVINTFLPPLVPTEDLLLANEISGNLLKNIRGTLYRIEDLTQIEMDFGQLVEGMALATKGNDGTLRSERIQTILVSPQSKLMKIASDGLKQDQYGNVNITAFPTVDQAIAYARREIATTN